jgi:hypothetical protein
MKDKEKIKTKEENRTGNILSNKKYSLENFNAISNLKND